MPAVTLTDDEGTIRVDGDPGVPLPGVESDPRSKSKRAPAFHYQHLRNALRPLDAWTANDPADVLDEGVDVPDANVAVVFSEMGSEREFTQRLGRVLRPKDVGVPESSDSGPREATKSPFGGRAVMYEVVTEETAEERVADRRR